MEYIMNNPNLGVLLRYYRKAAHLTVKDVAAKFQNEYNTTLSTKTIYGWEGGQNQPSADTLLTLCKMYNITNIVESLGYAGPIEQTPLILSDEEREIIKKYRSHKVFHAAVSKLMELE